jgi:hypothetical protein
MNSASGLKMIIQLRKYLAFYFNFFRVVFEDTMLLLIPGEAAASRLLRTNGLASWELPRDGLLATYVFV